jgi:hypothetical protein
VNPISDLLALLGAVVLSGTGPGVQPPGNYAAQSRQSVCERPVADDPRIMRCPAQMAEAVIPDPASRAVAGTPPDPDR